MIRAIIIDDEKHCINRLERLLVDYCKDSVFLQGSFLTVADGLQAITTLKPNLVFLDIRIQSQTGFDLLKQLPAMDLALIFTTAFEKYALQAFKFSAVDYLLKPVDPEELIHTIVRVEKKIFKEEAAVKLEVLLQNLMAVQGQSKKIAIPTPNGLIIIAVNEIIRCQANINYTTIFMKDSRKITIAKTLKEFETLLSDYNFFRVHNSHMVNLSYVKSYQRGKGGTLLMTDRSEIEVSIRRKERLLKRLSGLPF